MRSLIIRRMLQAALTLVGVSLLTFLLVRATGDPASIMLPSDASPEAIQAFHVANGLDKPLVQQYLLFLQNASQGNLGNSIRYREPVATLLGQRLLPTLQLTFTAVFIAAVVGFILGALGALSKRRWIDASARSLALSMQAIPTFYLGIILILVFGVMLQWFPTYGRNTSLSIVLPAATLAIYLIPLILRVTRGGYLDVKRQEYIRTARAKGMTERQIFLHHLTKNALIPITTVIGLQVGAALSGAVVTEKVFSWPGVGQLLVDSVSNRDFPVVQAVVLYAAAAFIVINLLVDLAYTALDPRIRMGA